MIVRLMPEPMARGLRLLVAALFAAALAACQSVPKAPSFTPEQIAVLTQNGFVEADAGWTLTLGDRLLFAFDSSALRPEQLEQLTSIASQLAGVGITTARVDGHTDSLGAAAYNQRLSLDRANAVVTALRQGGMTIGADQIFGRGAAFPVADNASEDGRAENRRVVILVTPQ